MAKVKGLDKVLKKLHKETKKIKGNTRKGLSKAGLMVKGESMEMAPAVTGVLRNSAFSRVSSLSKTGDPFVSVGYTAEYAPYVHEAPMRLSGSKRPKKIGGTYWDNGENKFLEKAVKRNMRRILKIIADEASKDLEGRKAR